MFLIHVTLREWRPSCHDRRVSDVATLSLFALALSVFLLSCTPTAPASTPQLVTVYSSAAAQPWLDPLYACAGSTVVISRVDDPSSAGIILRMGEPDFIDSPVYQIDNEEILIVTHRESQIPAMNLEEVQALFAGEADPAFQVWVYASDDDIQKIFDEFVMKERRVSPSAHVATSPQHMIDVLESERQAVGILPLSWSMKMNGSGGVYQVATVPVLAITNAEPQGVIQELLACLQK